MAALVMDCATPVSYVPGLFRGDFCQIFASS